MPLYKVIVEKHQDGYVAYPLGLSYALPISMGELIISLMTNQAYDTSSRRCSPREIVITPASANLCPTYALWVRFLAGPITTDIGWPKNLSRRP